MTIDCPELRPVRESELFTDLKIFESAAMRLLSGGELAGAFVVYGLILLVFLWMTLRAVLFFVDRISSFSLPPEALALSVWIERIFLCLLAGLLALAFVIEAREGFGQFRGVSYAGRLECFGNLAMGVYWTAALILNFPGFPFRWLMVVFWPIQLVLVPGLLTAQEPGALVGFAIVVLCFGGYWRWNIFERQRLE